MIEIKQLNEVTPEVVSAFTRLLAQLSPDCQVLEIERFQKIVNNESVYGFGAHNPAIIGTLTLALISTPSGTKAWIEDVVVDISVRKQGVGKQLIQYGIDFAKELKVASVNLTSRAERVAANELYKEMGFILRETNVYRLVINPA